jgi:hypothetical protein
MASEAAAAYSPGVFSGSRVNGPNGRLMLAGLYWAVDGILGSHRDDLKLICFEYISS